MSLFSLIQFWIKNAKLCAKMFDTWWKMNMQNINSTYTCFYLRGLGMIGQNEDQLMPGRHQAPRPSAWISFCFSQHCLVHFQWSAVTQRNEAFCNHLCVRRRNEVTVLCRRSLHGGQRLVWVTSMMLVQGSDIRFMMSDLRLSVFGGIISETNHSNHFLSFLKCLICS